LHAQKEENERAERDKKDEVNREWPEWKAKMEKKYGEEF